MFIRVAVTAAAWVVSQQVVTQQVAAQQVPEQPVDWPSYLAADARARVGAAVELIDGAHEEAARARQEREALLEEIYVVARDESLDPRAYAELLREHVGREAVSRQQPQARRTIAAVFREDPPLPGTPAAKGAEAWLRSLASRELFPVGRLDDLVYSVETSYLRGASAAQARDVLDSIAAAGGLSYELPLGRSDQDRARERLALWTLETLAAEPHERVELLDLLGRELELVRAAASRLASDYDEVLALCDRLVPGPEVLAAVSPHLFADPGRSRDSREALAALGEFVASLTECDAAAVEPSAELAFLTDTMQVLLLHASDLQRYRLAQTMGLSPSQLESIRLLLYRIRAARATLPAEVASLRAQPPRRGGELERFLSEGRALIDAARPWVDGERSRSGDSFRWAMLAIVSHPYAQYLLATDPELGSTADMVSTFVSRTHTAAIRRAGAAVASLAAVSAGDGVLPYHRVYRVPARAAEALYEAFAVEAQGIEELSREFSRPYVAGLTTAGYWSHLHGLQVIAERSPDPGSQVDAQAAPWFALARATDNPMERLSLLVRGLVSLRRVTLEEIHGAGASAGSASVRLVAPRLSTTLGLLEQLAGYEVDPVEVFDLLSLLYEVAPGTEITDGFASELSRIVVRLRMESDDRALLVGAMTNEAFR